MTEEGDAVCRSDDCRGRAPLPATLHIVILCGLAGVIGLGVYGLLKPWRQTGELEHSVGGHEESPVIAGGNGVDIQVEHDFGIVGVDSTLRHDFKLVNRTATLLSVVGVTTTCGCVSPLNETLTIASGETGYIPIEFRPGAAEGRVEKGIKVHLRGDRVTDFWLRLSATVRPLLAVHPESISISVDEDADSIPLNLHVANWTGEAWSEVSVTAPE